jgi:hypothetical protein
MIASAIIGKDILGVRSSRLEMEKPSDQFSGSGGRIAVIDASEGDDRVSTSLSPSLFSTIV